MAATTDMTTLLVPVSEAEHAVESCRAKHDWSARAGVPAHITLLGPFLPPEEVGPDVLERLRELFASFRPLRFRLAAVERLPNLVYLTPEPVAPFRQLTEALERAWPEAPPFGDGFERPLHHLTVARDGSAYEEITDELSGRLPIDATAQEVLLFEKRADLDVRRIGRFPLAG